MEVAVESCSEKRHSKNLGQILKKNPQLWRSSLLEKLQARSLQIYLQINSSTGIFPGKSFLFLSYLCVRIPRTPSFRNIFRWLLLKIACSLFQCILSIFVLNICFNFMTQLFYNAYELIK